ncbi:pancreatic progenitor cell differentiation and proliferation factor-like protein isoform X1 [Passer montanus]|uniref:pancreatic progenitor cell differentiation and proliferation factor-like protein isoform X1 n=1 Tax=Passer montanus TaxID=9160 RepID=UPI0019605701|nr:pancreatic progenitor cell differentiation and proliferation factor-like protein isoform X1 [Passer montanus]
MRSGRNRDPGGRSRDPGGRCRDAGTAGDCPGPTRAVQGGRGRGLLPLPSPRSRPARATAPGRGERPCRSHKGRPRPWRRSLRSGVALGLCKAAPWDTQAPPGKAGFPVCRCHGLRPVRRLPPGQEPVLPELNSESSVSSSSSCCLDAVNITDQDKALHGLPELIDKHWWIKSFFHSEPSPPTVGRKTLSASSTNS